MTVLYVLMHMRARDTDSGDPVHRDWNAELEQWGWTCNPPPSQRTGERDPNNPKTRKRKVSELAAMVNHRRIRVHVRFPIDAGREILVHDHGPLFCCCVKGEAKRKILPDLTMNERQKLSD